MAPKTLERSIPPFRFSLFEFVVKHMIIQTTEALLEDPEEILKSETLLL